MFIFDGDRGIKGDTAPVLGAMTRRFGECLTNVGGEVLSV